MEHLCDKKLFKSTLSQNTSCCSVMSQDWEWLLCLSAPSLTDQSPLSLNATLLARVRFLICGLGAFWQPGPVSSKRTWTRARIWDENTLLCLDPELGRAHYLPHKFAHNVDFPLKCFLHAGTERQHQLIKHSTLSDHPWHTTDAQKITRADRDPHLYRSLRLDSV